jgi:hypothetical protein
VKLEFEAVKAEKKTSGRKRKTQYRFGIGEWYGKSFVKLTAAERRFYASIQGLPDAERPPQLCPFLSKVGKPVNCSKPGGICSLRSYEKPPDGGVVAVDSRASSIRTTCPNRFEEAGTIYRWIGKTLLGDEAAVAVGETPFLERTGYSIRWAQDGTQSWTHRQCVGGAAQHSPTGGAFHATDSSDSPDSS